MSRRRRTHSLQTPGRVDGFTGLESAPAKRPGSIHSTPAELKSWDQVRTYLAQTGRACRGSNSHLYLAAPVNDNRIAAVGLDSDTGIFAIARSSGVRYARTTRGLQTNRSPSGTSRAEPVCVEVVLLSMLSHNRGIGAQVDWLRAGLVRHYGATNLDGSTLATLVKGPGSLRPHARVVRTALSSPEEHAQKGYA